jgi:hypothetical protein
MYPHFYKVPNRRTAREEALETIGCAIGMFMAVFAAWFFASFI